MGIFIVMLVSTFIGNKGIKMYQNRVIVYKAVHNS